MPLNFDKNLSKKYIHCNMLGKGTLEDVSNYIAEITSDPDLDEPFFEIVDFTQVENLDFGYYQSEEMMNQYLALAENKGYKGTIFVTGNEFGQGVANMFTTAGTFKGLNLKVVSSLEEAELLIAEYFD